MKCNKGYFLLGMLLMWTVQANELDTLIKSASGKAEVVTATAGELQAFKDKLKSLFNGSDAGGDWHDLKIQQVNLRDVVILQESPTAKQGLGVFAVRMQATNNRLIQAPHADSDLYTGKIASRLFLEGGFKAAQWNSVKRNISDMAHTPNTYWQIFTEAFAERYPDGKIIQLHGFERSTRKTKAGESSEIILSAGHDAPPPWIQQTADCLKKALPNKVSLYQFDVKELGGTTNVQGQLLRSHGHDGFLHIEMSKDMRNELLDNVELRKLFINCL